MNRDPSNNECTRDPIFLLQVGTRQWTQIPDGIESDGDGMWVREGERDDVPEWMEPFIDDDGNVDLSPEFYSVAEKEENDNGWPMIYVEWRTESVFLTRQECEDYARKREYRWPMWRVYCIPCDGELARILNEL